MELSSHQAVFLTFYVKMFNFQRKQSNDSKEGPFSSVFNGNPLVLRAAGTPLCGSSPNPNTCKIEWIHCA